MGPEPNLIEFDTTNGRIIKGKSWNINIKPRPKCRNFNSKELN